jgi:hypothetical protein
MSEEGGVMPTDSADHALVQEVTPHAREGALGTWMARSTERRSEHRVGQPGGLRLPIPACKPVRLRGVYASPF